MTKGTITAVLLLCSSSVFAGPCTEEINQLVQQRSVRDAGSGPTSGSTTQSTPGQTQPQHPPTATMSKETQGRAASPEDVQRQTAGQPPAAQQPRGTMSSASDALNRARMFDQQGNERDCMSAVEEAKKLQ